MPIDLNATYAVTCNNFMATGGDGFTTFVSGRNQVGGPIDLDVLIQYVKDHTPFTAGTAQPHHACGYLSERAPRRRCAVP